MEVIVKKRLRKSESRLVKTKQKRRKMRRKSTPKIKQKVLRASTALAAKSMIVQAIPMMLVVFGRLRMTVKMARKMLLRMYRWASA